MAIHVNVTCKIIHPGVTCTETTLECVAFMRQTSSDVNSDILSAFCRHIQDTSSEQDDEVFTSPSNEDALKTV